MIVSFSGIDGAGKSTQIEELECWLRKSGMRTQLLTFWDDVVLFSKAREFMSLKAFKGDPGVGSPEKPLERRDKNVSSSPLTLARFFFYLADAVSLVFKVLKARRSRFDVVIFDRYIYDELANLPLQHGFSRFFTRFILSFAPRPDCAFVIDADPDAAYARKPEYPLEFVRRNRETYIALASFAPNMKVIRPDSVSAMKHCVRTEVLEQFGKIRLGPQIATGPQPVANISSSKFIEP